MAMYVYVIGTLPLISKLQGIIQQCLQAINSTSDGSILSLKYWWDLLLLLEPQYGYFSNGAKPWLVVKEGAVDTARKVFNGSDIHITTDSCQC